MYIGKGIGQLIDKFAPRSWRDVPLDEVLAIVLEDAQGKIVIRRKG